MVPKQIFKALTVATIGGSLSGCLDPTQVTLEISTDAECDDLDQTGIWAGVLGELELPDATTVTQRCESNTGRIGSLVVVPSDGDDEAVAFRVATSIGGSLDLCRAPPYDPSCIVARRALRFVPQTPLTLPIPLRVDCQGIPCEVTETCVRGQCRPATLPDALACAEPDGCSEATVLAQDPTTVEPAWFRHFGGQYSLSATDVIATPAGQIYVAGTAAGQTNFDQFTVEPKGQGSVFVVSILTDGGVDWLQQLGASDGIASAPKLALGQQGSLYATGTFVGLLEYGSHEVGAEVGAGFVARITPSGGGAWLALSGTSQEHVAGGIAVDHRGNVRVSGGFMEQLEFAGQQYTSVGTTIDGYIVSFDSDHQPQGAVTLGGVGEDVAVDLAVDSRANGYAVGDIGSTADFGGGPLTHNGGQDGFITSFTPEGDHRWSVSLGGDSVDQLWAVDVGPLGSIYAAGEFSSTIELGGQQIEALGARNGMVVSFTADGSFRWAGYLRSSGVVHLRSVAVSPAGNVYAAGDFTEDLRVGNDLHAATAASDLFVVSYATDGSHRWTQWISGDGTERARGIAVTANGEVLVAGHCDDNVDFGPESPTCSATRDAFILKLASP